MARISWDEYFMSLANEAAKRSTCDRLSVGCLLVRDKRVVGTGYNGSVSGREHCDDVGHLYNAEQRCIRTVHAEQNAIADCAKRGVATDGATAYVTHEPCENCTKLLLQAGVVRIVFRSAYENKYNQHFIGDVEWHHLKAE